MQTSHKRISILGVPIDDILLDEAVEHINGFFQAGGCHHVVTVNPEFVMEAQNNPRFRDVLHAAALATPDGTGLLLAARWLKTPLRGRVTGVELSERLAQLCAAEGRSIFLLGAAEGVAEQTAAIWQERYPGLTIAGCFAGSPKPEHAPAICQLIKASKPDLLLVAYGHPKQDLWIAHYQPELGVPVAMGVGGVFDYVSGRVPRAPLWMRRLGLEWLYRLIRQPQRWKRIWVAFPLFSWTVLRHGRRFMLP